MRIGLATPSWPGGAVANGITTSVAYLAEGLRACGHDVTIIAFSESPSGNDPPVIPLPPGRRMTLRERIACRLGRDDAFHHIYAERIAAAVLEAVRTRGVEVLVIEETHGWAGVVQRRVPIPVVVALHGPWFLQRAPRSKASLGADRRRERREAAAFRTCAGVAAPSRDVLRRTEAAHDLPPRPRAVVHNAIPLKEPLVYSELDGEARRSILFVGRFDKPKGADTLLEGFAELIRTGTDARLTFVGPDVGIARPGGGSMRIAEAVGAQPGDVRSRIDYLGKRSKTEIDELRLRHAVAVVASRYEIMPYTLLESLAAGAATVCTAAGGPAEIVRHGETGLLIPPEDPAALAAACRTLIEDQVLAEAVGAAARSDIAARFAPPKIAEQMAAFLETVQTGTALPSADAMENRMRPAAGP